MAGASSVLLKPPAAGPAEPVSVLTYAGKTEITMVSVHPAAAVTMALLTDSLTAEQLAALKKDLLAAYTPARGARLHLALLQSGGLVKGGPFPTRLRFKAALDEIRLPAAPAVPPSGAALVEALATNAAQFGGDWSSVVFVGDFPALEKSSIDYAVARLLREFSAQRVRVSWMVPPAVTIGEEWLPLIRATGGSLLGSTARDLASAFDPPGEFLQIDWTAPSPLEGFICAHSMITGAAGATLLELPEIFAPPQAVLPAMELYGQLRSKAAEAAALARQESRSPESAQQVVEALKVALGINPRDAEALLAAATFYEKFQDYASAARFRTWLAEIQPLNGAAQAALGHVLYLNSELDKADAALARAAALNTKTPQMAEDLARIRIARKDDQGALPYLAEVLSADAGRQDIWFLKGQAGARLGNAAIAIQAFERGLALGGVHVEETRSLLALYIKEGQTEKAGEFSAATLAKLPADAAVRGQFAAALEDLDLRTQALAAWRRVLEVSPEAATAHEHIARLLLLAGDFAAANRAAEAGLSFNPQFAGLYLVKADALEKLGRYYETRRTLQQGAEAAGGAELLLRLASIEETYSGTAAAVYQRLADLPQLPPQERVLDLRKGLAVALRDGGLQQARGFADSLKASGHPEDGSWLGSEENAGDSVMVFGGLAALGFAARAKEQVPPERFFADYARSLIDHNSAMINPQAAKFYMDSLDQYLQRLRSLESHGVRRPDRLQITLSLQEKDARSRAESVLGLLGFRLRSGRNGPELDLGEGKAQARNQETLAALAIDQVAMQEAFQAGKSFVLEIPYERAVIYPGEKMWRESFFAGETGSEGFAAALAHDLKLAHLYLGMSYLDRDTITQLLSAVDLLTLHRRYAGLFSAFAPAFAMHGGRAVCPGGRAAEPLWEKMTGASLGQPGRFFRALLERDNGTLLAYFFTLAHLDPPRQAFFTANSGRLEQFYRLFAAFRESQPGALISMRDNAFPDFLRSVPIDKEGHVAFPGSPAVWMVAKAHADADTRISKLSKASMRWVGAAVEDEVLVRLAQTRYKEKEVRHTELDNFLAVARIDAHRAQPLDDESALLLAQRHSEASESYAYFTDLTALQAADFRQFFAVLERLRAQPPLDANLRLGQMHALIEWICLLKQRQAVSDVEAARLFGGMLERFASAGGAAGYAAASLESAQAILDTCKLPGPAASPAARIRACLTGGLANRDQEFAQVLELQKVPSLDALFSIYHAVNPGAEQRRDAPALEKSLAAWPVAELGPRVKIPGKAKEQILRYSPAGLQKLAAQLIQKSGSSKSALRDAEKLRREALAELEPQVALALSGVVYAYYLRPADLLVAADPLLLRKHRYFDFESTGRDKLINQYSEFYASSEGAGSYFLGSFAGFALAAGNAAGASWKTGGVAGADTVAAQIAAIRSTPWDLLTESDLRLVGLRIAAAREWIVESATHPEAEEALRATSVGILSLSRRADLLNGIRSRNWARVWEAITLPDLLELGSRYLDNFKKDAWPSVVTGALRQAAAANDGARLRWLGAVPSHSFGCSHAHWRALPPYEEYEHRFFAAENAERWAEFKIYLAFQADQAGGEAASLSRVAETLAARAFRAAHMSDFHDWRSVLAGYSSITISDLKRALQP